MCHRGPFGRKCVRRRVEKCGLEGPGRQGRCRTRCPQGRPRVRFRPFLFAQMPPRAAESTFSAFFVRSGAPEGSREYDLEHFCSRRCPKETWNAFSGRICVTHFREMCHRRPFGRKCVEWLEKESALEGPGGQLRVLLVRAGAKDPLLEMRGRQVRWKCAHVQGGKCPPSYPPGPDYRLFSPSR